MLDNTDLTVSSTIVCVNHTQIKKYPTHAPFHPDARFPEYKGEIGPENPVYAAIRETFRLMKLDPENFGTERWNPLKNVVFPGDRVVLKPNFLAHTHRIRRGEWDYVITNGSIIRAVLDYVEIALMGQGEIWVTDGPQFDADWDKILSLTGLIEVKEYCQSHNMTIPIRLVDLRPEWWPDVRDDVTNKRVKLPGDPAGPQMIDLGKLSAFNGRIDTGKYYGSDYDQTETNRHHQQGKHEYLISKTCSSADVFINLPKMKTHKKVGVTLCLKNLVGINMGRNWLPHHTDGSPIEGGDAFPNLTSKRKIERNGIRTFEHWMIKYPKMTSPIFRFAKRIGRKIWGDSHDIIRNGNWYGNDTCWRMVHDINKCLLYSNGVDYPVFPSKRYLGIVDGIIAGEGDGPASPDPVNAGVIIAGYNPVAIDATASWIMGFDPMKIPLLRNAFEDKQLPLVNYLYEDIMVASNNPLWNGLLRDLPLSSSLKFKPHFGWYMHIENFHKDL
jgi:uncharacterized protein (DUF362 family)